MQIQTCFVVLAVTLQVACGDGHSASPSLLDPPTQARVDEGASVLPSDATLGTDLYRIFAARPGNMLFSPHAVGTALAMIHLGAAGTTATQIAAAAGWGEGAAMQTALGRGLSQGSALPVHHGDALWLAPDVRVNPDFPFLLGVSVGATVQRVDFRYPDFARSQINAWGARQSGGTINELVTRGEVQGTTRMLITTSVSMAAGWETAFSAPAPVPAPFFIDDGTAPEIQTVQQVSALPFAATEQVSAVEIPCVGGDVSLMVLLPRNSLQNLEADLTSDTLRDLRHTMHRTQVRLSIPVFEVTSMVSLRDALRSLGITDVFDPQRAQLPGIDMTQQISLDDMVQSATLRITSPGAVATADAGLEGALTDATGSQGVSTMQVNRPFVFALMDLRAGSVLFMGRVEHP